MVKRKSSLASNQVFQVQILVGLLNRVVTTRGDRANEAPERSHRRIARQLPGKRGGHQARRVVVFVVYRFARDPVKVEETSSILAEHPWSAAVGDRL